MGTPVEKQNHNLPFFVLATLILVCTAWSFYDEFVSRRPWQGYQRAFFELEAKKLERDLAYAGKVFGSKQVQDQLAALELDLHLAGDEAAGLTHPEHAVNPEIRRAHQKKLDDRERLKIDVADDDMKTKFAKSEWDGRFYRYRHAIHEAKLAKDPAARRAREMERDAHLAELKRIEALVAERGRALTTSEQALAEAEKAVAEFVGRRDEIRRKIEALSLPVAEVENKIREARAKSPDYAQYWIPRLNVVDRCQNCHAGIERCGFSTPNEPAEAIKREEPEDEVAGRYCLDPDTLKDYVAVYDALCEGADAVPDEKEATEALSSDEIKRLEQTAPLYCGKRPLVVRWRIAGRNFLAAPDTAKSLRDLFQPRAAESEGRGPRPPAAGFDLPVWARSHPHKAELLGSNHPPDQFGCTNCHGGQGSQTKGVGRFGWKPQEFAHGYDDHYWETPLLDRVSYRVHQANPAGDPVRRTHQRQFVESSCARCHTAERNLKFASTLMRGRKLVSELACYGCHPIDGYNEMRRPGPKLTAVREKMSAGFLVQWIKHPRGLRPRTRMPNFWPEALDKDDRPKIDSDAFKRRETEVTGIAAYLWSTSAQTAYPAPPRGNAERGRQLFDEVGCRGCHAIEPHGQRGHDARPIEASRARDYAPNLSDAGSKLSEPWLYAWLKNPTAYWSQTRMPNLRLTDAEAADLTAYLITLTEGRTYPTPDEFDPSADPAGLSALAAEGKALVSKYGCFGCHDVAGFAEAQRIGAELNDFGRKFVDLLDFGDVIVNPREHTWFNWVDLKLRFPRAYTYDVVEARMPQFDLTDDEIDALMVLLKSLTLERLPHEYLASKDQRKKAIHRGEKGVENLGCRNCHVIDDAGGLIRDRYMTLDERGNVVEDQTALAPPVLTGEGFKTQPPWLYQFLRRPGPLRPWLTVRMPTFPLGVPIETVAGGASDPRDRATEIVHYFSAAANKPYPFLFPSEAPPPDSVLAESRKLFDAMGCLKCHFTGTIPADRPREQLAPDFALAKRRLRPDWIDFWLYDPQVFQPGTKMPTFFGEGGYFPGHFGNDGKKQIRALRDYLMNLPEPAIEPAARKGTKVSQLAPASAVR